MLMEVCIWLDKIGFELLTFNNKKGSICQKTFRAKLKIVADHLGIDEAKITEESSFIDDLGADSLDTVELVMAFEEEFGSEISDRS